MTINKKKQFNTKRDNGFISKLIFKLYGIPSRLFRVLLRKLMWHYLGFEYEFYSTTLRKIYITYHGVEIGMYTYGACFHPQHMPPGTNIGRYCSIAWGTAALENHLMSYKSTHAFFFNPAFGYVRENPILKKTLTIGNDVWIGQNTLILPGCANIGDGAIIGAGSIVTKDIPPYAIAIGNPCKVVRYRFSKEKIEELLSSKWWENPIEDIINEIDGFRTTLEVVE